MSEGQKWGVWEVECQGWGYIGKTHLILASREEAQAAIASAYRPERFEARPYPGDVMVDYGIKPIGGGVLGRAAAAGLGGAVGELKAEKLLRERGNGAVAKAFDAAALQASLDDARRVLDAWGSRVQTILDESFGLHTLMPTDDVLTTLERHIFQLRQAASPYATSQLRDELGTAQRDLADARASEEEARADAVVLRRRVAALTEQVRRLRLR
jgi:hypothetical protein